MSSSPSLAVGSSAGVSSSEVFLPFRLDLLLFANASTSLANLRSSDNLDCYWGHPERALPPPSFMVSESGIVTQVPKEFVRKWWGEIVNGLPDEKAKVHEDQARLAAKMREQGYLT